MQEKPSFKSPQYKEYLDEYKDEFTKVLSALETVNFPKRIKSKDYTLWSSSPDEIVNRLGWLTLPDSIINETDELKEFYQQIINNDFKSIVLIGMGGSSLAPEMFAESFKGINKLNIFILDCTDPDYILSVRNQLDLSSTLIIVSSKSGSTVETASLMNYFLDEYDKVMDRKEIGSHFVSITDPGSGLESVSGSLGFRNIFLNDPNIGGRFSALSYFGLVPASLTGLDCGKLIKRSNEIFRNCDINDINLNTGLRLGAFMGCMAEKGIDKLTIYTSKEISCLKFWIEQLVAESTGKDGKGILPVPADSFDPDIQCGNDRLFVYIKTGDDEDSEKEINSIINSGMPLVVMELENCYGLGGQIYLWEYATAVAGYFLKVNPFDQPDVESAKIFTKGFVEKYKETGLLQKEQPDFNIDDLKFYSNSGFTDFNAFNTWLNENVVEGSYISIQAFLTPDNKTGLQLSGLQKKLASKFRQPVTAGIGPRYLHSSGQLHKGDAGKGIFIQLTSDTGIDIPIPDEPFVKNSFLSFGVLKNAQALGDYVALKDKGRNIVSINLGMDKESGLIKLINLF